MKDQYFGDINDYRKYGLLRLLSAFGSIPTTVCWMRTMPDGRTDGSAVDYLCDPSQYRAFDPQLFDHLRASVCVRQRRAVSEAAGILAGTTFMDEILRDNITGRSAWFHRFLSVSRSSSLIFFDPDNGMEVRSVPAGRKWSSKYLYWNELVEAYISGKSVLVYQHFPRAGRTQFICGMVDASFRCVRGSVCFTFHSSRVLFVLLPQPEMEGLFDGKAREVARQWHGQFTVSRFVRATDGMHHEATIL